MTQFPIFPIKAVLFVLILAALMHLIDVRLDYNMPRHNQLQYAELIHPKVKADVIILGSSTAVHGYSPAILSRINAKGCDFSSIYDFGLLGAQPPFYSVWYKEFIGTYYKKPSLVILSLDWFSSAKREEATDGSGKFRLAQDSHYLPWKVWGDVFINSDKKGKVVLVSNLFRLMRASLDIVHVVTPRHEKLIENFYRGYMPLDHSLEASSNDKRVFLIDDVFIQSLRELIHEIKEGGTDIVLVQIPTLFPEKIVNIDESKVFQTIADEEHIPYLNYNDQLRSEINTDPAFFSDWSHLNRSGSTLYSNQVKDDIDLLINKGEMTNCLPANSRFGSE